MKYGTEADGSPVSHGKIDDWHINPEDYIDSKTLVVDRHGSVTETIHFDHDALVLKFSADVEPDLEANKEFQTHWSGWTADRSMKHMARIPEAVKMIWDTELGDNCMKPEYLDFIRRKLNSNEWQFLRTGAGKL